MTPISQANSGVAPLPVADLTAKPRLVVTLGDAAGIGPEVVLRAVNQRLRQQAEITLIGDRTLCHQTYEQLRTIASAESTAELTDPDTLPFIDLAIGAEWNRAIQTGVGSAASGELSFRTLQTAISKTLAGEFDGIVTAPIAKSAWLAAGHRYPGQTELLAEMAEVARFGMLFVARSPHNGWALRTLLATTHIPLRTVADTLSSSLMTVKLELLIDCLKKDFGLRQPRIAIAGLNPHSGEQGQLGDEEKSWLLPWLIQQRQRFPQAQLDGPVPPDTLWVRPGQAWHGAHSAAHDAYLALYHDQGLIPVKLLAFDRAVNTTIGLPFIRTSPDHGTAFDIAGQGLADGTSMVAAIELAIELCRQRLANRH